MKVQVFSDYVCPYCFLAEQPLNDAIDAVATDGNSIEVDWMPFELRPYPTPTLKPEGDYLQTAWQRSVYPLAQRLGVHIVLPRVAPQPYTRLAFEGSLIANKEGKAREYNHRLFTAFFQDELDIGDVNVLAALAEEIGLDRERYEKDLVAGTYQEACGELLRRATEDVGVSAVPTFAIGRRMIPGMVSKESLEKVIREEITRES
jgi:predicted DsbA family dithiol-disulfide isomerase